MVGCSAFGCKNRSEQGFLMKIFPIDPQRRKEWITKVKRKDWTPSRQSYLCEVHFEPEMWEKTREDGSRKLKWNAIPTIFSFTQPRVKRKTPAKRRKVEFDEAHTSNVDEPSHNVVVEQLEPHTSTFDEPCQVIVVDEMEESKSTASDAVEIAKESSTFEQLLSIEKKENMKLRDKLKLYEKVYVKLNKKLKKKEMTIRTLKLNIKQLSSPRLNAIFNDQKAALCRKKTYFMKWSNATVSKALKLKFSCGNNGYEELLKQNMPLPSLRTLTRRLQNIYFDSGVLEEVFEMLKIKVQDFKSAQERDCAITIDEMAITPGNSYDPALKKYIGAVTLPGHKGVATHALVCMIGGVTTRWKQTVAYFFTSDSVNGKVYKEILLKVIKESENLGLNVVSITSDMGSSNQALWKIWGIVASRHSKVINYIPHPFDDKRRIYILADVPHLFKNIKNMLMTNKVIEISNEIQNKYQLPTNTINSKHIQDLIDFQSELNFKLAPKLAQEDLSPSHFQKMRVSKSTNVISHDVVSGLRFISDETKKPEYLTTAWFLSVVEKWFALMTSRHPVVALSKRKPEVYEETVQFLKDVMDIFVNMKVGPKHSWKPSQTGLLISTQSILDIQQFLLGEKEYVFLLTGRFTQDCLENLFSVVRSKQLVPNALQFKNNLKLVTVSQYLRDTSKGSYDVDDREFIANFLDIDTPKPTYDAVKLPEINLECSSVITLNNSEMNSLYNIAGYLLTSISKTHKVCENCIISAGSKNLINFEYSKLINIRCFKKNTLFYCTIETFNLFVTLENIFRRYYDIVSPQNVNIKDFFVEKMMEGTSNVKHILPCHKLKDVIISRFVVFRLKIASKKDFKRKKLNASKSVMASSL